MVKKIIIVGFIVFIALPIAIFSWMAFGPDGVYHEVDHGQDKVIIIEKGSSNRDIVKLLQEKNLLRNQYSYYLALFLSQQYGKLKAGEFLIPQHARPVDIIKILCCGRVIVHTITLPEGLTVSEIIKTIQQLDHLEGEISRIPEEGMLLPETYTYVHGDSRQSLIDRMEKEMKKVLDQEWEQRQEREGYKHWREALIMASIIEKETGQAEERSRIAAVFLNRLKKGMKLQSDPTVIYGITLGKFGLGRLLNRQDLKTPTEYNTYTIEGLPPTAIACPGSKAIKAALNPLKTTDLYFVANGSGGHHFSSTYQQHFSHVQNWRRLSRAQ